MSNLSRISQLTGELLLHVPVLITPTTFRLLGPHLCGGLRQDAWFRYSSWFASPIYRRSFF